MYMSIFIPVAFGLIVAAVLVIVAIEAYIASASE
jgi:hypothetical protein